MNAASRRIKETTSHAASPGLRRLLSSGPLNRIGWCVFISVSSRITLYGLPKRSLVTASLETVNVPMAGNMDLSNPTDERVRPPADSVLNLRQPPTGSPRTKYPTF